MLNITATFIGAKEFFTMIDFLYHLWLVIIVFGMMSNVINITVFFIIGDRDNVTISLLVLSLSDLCYLVIRSLTNVAQFLLYHYPRFTWDFDPKIFLVCVYWYSHVFYDFSCFVSVFLAVVRCCCVVMPLKFKTVFTSSRTVKGLVGLFIMAVSLRAPQIFGHSLTWKLNHATNTTQLTCAETRDIQILAKVNDIVNRNIITTIAYVTVVVCVVTMIVQLRVASKFRNSASHSQSSTVATEISPDTTADVQKRKEKHFETMSTKEIQLIQSVILLSVIFLLSQLPFQLYSTIRLFMPEFDTRGSKVFLFGIAGHISMTFAFLNCSVNIFVYLTYNRKYRERFFAAISH